MKGVNVNLNCPTGVPSPHSKPWFTTPFLHPLPATGYTAGPSKLRHGNCPWKRKFPWQWKWLSAPPPQNVRGENSGNKPKKGRTGFSSAPNTRKMYRVCSHVAIAHLGRVIANTVTCCYSRRLAIGLNADILARFCAMFQLRKRECYAHFESNFSGVGGCYISVFLSNQFPCLKTARQFLAGAQMTASFLTMQTTLIILECICLVNTNKT